MVTVAMTEAMVMVRRRRVPAHIESILRYGAARLPPPSVSGICILKLYFFSEVVEYKIVQGQTIIQKVIPTVTLENVGSLLFSERCPE